METVQKPLSSESVNVLLIGNNPLEMSHMLTTLSQIRGSRIFTETAFDVKSIWDRLVTFKPNYILIDDNIGHDELINTIYSLSHNRRTRNIPITVLKNSNYKESIASSFIMDFVLKQNLTSDALYNALKNSLKFRKVKDYLERAYRRRKGLLRSLAG
jgi:DNA-binding NarL/FixJ family response regulator